MNNEQKQMVKELAEFKKQIQKQKDANEAIIAIATRFDISYEELDQYIGYVMTNAMRLQEPKPNYYQELIDVLEGINSATDDDDLREFLAACFFQELSHSLDGYIREYANTIINN